MVGHRSYFARSLCAGLFFVVALCSVLFPLSVQAQDGTGRLDVDAPAVYHSIALSPGFAEPYSVEMIVGGTDVDLFRLAGEIGNLDECAGFTTSDPVLRITWEGTDAGNRLILLFESAAPEDDPTMFVQVIGQDNTNSSNWCSDDTGGQYNPMVEIGPLPTQATITLWIGTYYPAVVIPGTLYIFQTSGEEVLVQPSPAPGFGDIWSETQLLGGLLIEEYCRAVTPAYPDARPLNGENLSWACWTGRRHNGELNLSAVCEWQYGAGSYAVQTGNSFLTYACYRRGEAGTSGDLGTPEAPVKVDYVNARNLPVGGQAMVVTSSGRPLPVYREPGATQSRFAQLPPGTTVEILAGPIYADGSVWWQIRGPNDIQGWAIAFGGSTETLVGLRTNSP